MLIHRGVWVNFLGGAWLGILVVATTPWTLARLGLEGFGLVGAWQLLLYVSLILDFGLGSACSRELARQRGLVDGGGTYRAVFSLFERPVAVAALLLLFLLLTAAPALASGWLNVRGLSEAHVAQVVRWMAVSVAAQFLTAFNLAALAGMGRMGVMNTVQAINNTLRYAGGALVLVFSTEVDVFFGYQALASTFGLVLSRWQALRIVGPRGAAPAAGAESPSLRRFAAFSSGMFLTAASGALLSNADRMVVAKLLSAEDLGKYTVALTAIGLLQTLVFAFNRAYFPRFAELGAGTDRQALRTAYYAACSMVGAVLLPVAVLFVVFTPELFHVWLGWSQPDAVAVSRLLVLGFTMAALMWLPATYQQAIGWTRLHVTLMAVALAIGLPLLVYSVRRYGLPGGAALMLTHGLIEITFGLWLMNRTCFPGENLLWYRRVVVLPLAWAVPPVLLSRALLPPDLGRLGHAGWLAGTAAVLAAGGLWLLRRRRRLGAPGGAG